MEEFFSLKGKKGRISGILYKPEKDPLKLGLLIAAPFAGEKIFSHRYLAELARSLCRSGITVIRFDYSGTGDSENKFEDTNITDRLADTTTAFEFLKTQPNLSSAGILGVRLGAAWALECINRKFIEPDWVCLADPVLNLKKYLDQALRTNVSAQTTTYKEIRSNRKKLIDDVLEGKKISVVGGFPLAKSFYLEAQELDSVIDLDYKNIPVLITRIGDENGKNSPEIAELIGNLEKRGISPNLVTIPSSIYWERPKRYFEPPTELAFRVSNWLSFVRIQNNINKNKLKNPTRFECSVAGINEYEQYIFFQNRAGNRLPGILHKPAFEVDNQKGIFLLELGIGTRTGMNGINTNFARDLSGMGFQVLRMDVQGCGDADGGWGDYPMPVYFESIEAGLFKNDTEDIINQIADYTNCHSWYVVGHCGAACTASQSCHKLDAVTGIVLVEMPFKPSQSVSIEDKQKIKSFTSWLRLIKGKSDYKYLAKKVFKIFCRVLQKIVKKIIKDDEKSAAFPLVTTTDANGFNKPVIEGFRKIIEQNKDTLLIFCDSSTAAMEFDSNKSLITMTNNFEIVSITESNHTFFLQDSQQKLIELLMNWFATRKPDRKS